MGRVGLYVKFTARSGQRDELAERLLAAATAMAGAPGCELYIINRSATEPDAVWVTEIWHSAVDHDASLSTAAAKELIEQTMPLLARPPERIDLHPLGGIGIEP